MINRQRGSSSHHSQQGWAHCHYAMSVHGHSVEECLSRGRSASVRGIESRAIGTDDGLSLERQRGRHAGDLKRSSFSKKLSSLKWNGVARNERVMVDAQDLKIGDDQCVCALSVQVCMRYAPICHTLRLTDCSSNNTGTHTTEPLRRTEYELISVSHAFVSHPTMSINSHCTLRHYNGICNLSTEFE